MIHRLILAPMLSKSSAAVLLYVGNGKVANFFLNIFRAFKTLSVIVRQQGSNKWIRILLCGQPHCRGEKGVGTRILDSIWRISGTENTTQERVEDDQ